MNDAKAWLYFVFYEYSIKSFMSSKEWKGYKRDCFEKKETKMQFKVTSLLPPLLRQ
jgi:hypothetical protein